MLFYDRKEMRKPVRIRNYNSFSKKRPALGAANIERIAVFSKLGQRNIIFRTGERICKSGSVNIQWYSVLVTDLSECLELIK